MNKQAWDNYWQTGFVSCFPTDGVAERTLRQLWTDVINNLQFHDDIALLELGCGNGFLTTIIADKLIGQPYQLFALDYSRVALDELIESHSGKIIVVQETKIEELPFTDASMDFVISNFAFEYAEQQQAIAQIVRVLKNNGQFICNMHAKQSKITEVSRCVLDALEKLLSDKELHNLIYDVIELKSNMHHVDNKVKIVSEAKVVLDKLRYIDEATRGASVVQEWCMIYCRL